MATLSFGDITGFKIVVSVSKMFRQILHFMFFFIIFPYTPVHTRNKLDLLAFPGIACLFAHTFFMHMYICPYSIPLMHLYTC